METKDRFEPRQSATREDWVAAALDMLKRRGVEGVKVVTLAKELGLTSGSFYWHFKKLDDLLQAVLDYWEHRLTDHIIRGAQTFEGAPEDRIFDLMRQVIQEGAAEPDHVISVWSNTDSAVAEVFRRTVERRHAFAAWMFSEVGFPEDEALTRGRLMVAYLMGESSTGLKAEDDWELVLRKHWKFLIRP